MLTLALALALTQTPTHRLFKQPNMPAGVSFAFFEAFPASGAGTTSACSTVAPTGAKGEALTFTRTGSATCTKTASGGLATTGIADGDLVVMSSNQPRVEYDSAGTLGLLVESARTNYTLRSQEFDNASWVKRTANSLWANDAGAPDGTQTADALHLNATTTPSGVDGIYQISACGGANPATPSIYVRGARPPDGGVPQSGTIDFIVYNAVVYTCGTCSYAADSWSRCSLPSFSAASASDLLIGNDSRTALCPGAVNRPAQDVLLWQVDCQNGSYITSPIPTTTAAATRNAEQASFNGSTWPVSPVSVAASVTAEWSGTSTAADIITGNVASNSGWNFGWTGATLRTQPCASGACATLDVAQGPTAGTTARWAFSYSGGATSIFKDAALIAGPTAKTAPASPWATITYVGSQPAWGVLNGIVSRLCLDPSPTRCR